MRSPNRQYLPAVDHLRALAALLIVYYHCFHLIFPRLAYHRPFNPSEWIYSSRVFVAFLIEGHTAVSLFLVISGFILTWGSLGKDISYRQFFRNRALRILPLLFFVLMVGVYVMRAKFQFLPFLQQILQLGALPGALELGPWTAVVWTVAVEIQLYLIFPFLHDWLNRDRVWPVVRVLLLAVLARVAGLALGANVLDLSYWTVLGRADQFIAGALLAYFMQRGRIPERMRWLLPVAAAAVLAAFYGFHMAGGWPATEPWRVFWPLAEAALWTFFVACYLPFAALLPRLVSRALDFVGEISYSMYLIHFLVVYIFAEHAWYLVMPGSLTTGILLTGTFAILPVVLAVSWLTYTTIERPFLDMRKRYTVAPPVPAK
jgi:peptidoglycan/LPS O-acetylase OafA/YrhL